MVTTVALCSIVDELLRKMATQRFVALTTKNVTNKGLRSFTPEATQFSPSQKNSEQTLPVTTKPSRKISFVRMDIYRNDEGAFARGIAHPSGA